MIPYDPVIIQKIAYIDLKTSQRIFYLNGATNKDVI